MSVNGSDLPQHALERLNRMTSGGGRLWTSDLTVNEFLLVREAGFEPLGLVVGSSIYHIGFQSQMFRKNEELTVLSEAMYHARELAMTRMEEEADQLGADGVIGVRLDVNRYEWGAGLAEFMAVGTAVKSTGESHRPAHGKPFTSDLSGQDFWTLLKTGWRPVGLVMGSCVYHVAHQTLGQALRTVGQNTEMVNFTQALYDARELAMERMQSEAQEIGAQGIVAVRLREGSHGWGSHVIEFFAVGTGVVEAKPGHEVPEPALILPLTD
jgi:uncharacterized protein YbjQ (UPF0145 family)